MSRDSKLSESIAGRVARDLKNVGHEIEIDIDKFLANFFSKVVEALRVLFVI